MILPYQQEAIQAFLAILPESTSTILEVGSDIPGLVVSALADKTGAFVVGINPSEEFPTRDARERLSTNAFFLRGDGRFLPFPDNFFDAIVSLATMEHILGIASFLNEMERVLRPKGLFFSNFGPIWSSAKGHHVYAVARNKEARFWKPGKNPIPDFAHLYMTPDEMRQYLSGSPCSEELIEPIINWIYYGSSINRYPFESYIDAFEKSPLLIQRLVFRNLNDIKPDDNTFPKLKEKYNANSNFLTSNISVLCRKSPAITNIGDCIFFNNLIRLKRFSYSLVFNIGFQILKRFPEIKPLVKTFIRHFQMEGKRKNI